MEKIDNVATVFINNTVTILLKEDKPLDEKGITEALSPHNIKITATKKEDSLPF